jgi:uncharacterized Zn finger protein
MTATVTRAPKHMAKITNRIEKFPVRLARATARDENGNLAGLELKKGFTNAAGKLVETTEVRHYAVTAEQVGDGMAFTLTQDEGETYTVEISEAMGNRCSCPAGKFGKPCKHVSSLLSIMARDQQKPRPAMVCRDVFDCHNDE